MFLKEIKMHRIKSILLLALYLMIPLLVFRSTESAISGADENEWTITMNYNDGSSRDSAVFVEKGAETALPLTPVRKGFSFNGWMTESGEPVNAAAYKPEGDITLVADWAIGKCMVTLTDGQTGEQLDQVEVDYGAALPQLPEPEKDGFSFRYWSLSADGDRIDTDSFTVGDDTTLYAVWLEETTKEYKVVFTASEYSEEHTEDKVLYVVEGGSVKKSDAPKSLERSGYKFEGWTTETPSDGNEWTIDTYPAKKAPKTVKIPYKPKEDTNLYAVWTIQQYMAIFNANYTDSPYKNGVVDSYKLLSNENVTEPTENPERENYVFEGWFTKAVGGEKADFESGIQLKANTGFYAHWKHQGVQTNIFHAEYTEFNPEQKYFGYSGSVQGVNCIVKDAGTVGTVLVDDYPANSKLPAGGGYYVSYQYERGDTLRFIINSSEVTKAKLVANLAVEVDSMDVASSGENATAIRVNGKELEYKLTLIRLFQEVEIAEVELNEGENIIEFVVANDNTVMGGTYRAVGFMTDYIKLDGGSATFTWSPIYDNLESN